MLATLSASTVILDLHISCENSEVTEPVGEETKTPMNEADNSNFPKKVTEYENVLQGISVVPIDTEENIISARE